MPSGYPQQSVPLKEVSSEAVTTDVRRFVEASQTERLVLTEGGRPVAVVVGIQVRDEEDIASAFSREFWQMIEERRRVPRVSRAELETILEGEE